MPESLRWLIVKKRVKQALKTLKMVAKINKKVLEDDIQLPTLEVERKVASGDVRLLFSSGYRVTTLVVWYNLYVAILFKLFNLYSWSYLLDLDYAGVIVVDS